MKTNKNTQRRQELVQIAARLFCDQGYETTTVRMLAEAMGIQSGSLFHHFKDKQEILFAVIDSGMQHAIAIAQRALQQAQTPQQKLFALAKAHLSTLLEDRDAHVVAIYEWRSLSVDSRARLVELRDAYEALWIEAMDEALAAQLITGDTALRRRLALGALNWTVQWYQPQGRLSPDDLAQALVAMVLNQTAVNQFY